MSENYEHLQAAYIVERDGEECIVPLASMTEAELESVMKRLTEEGESHRRHADALRLESMNRSAE
jgi:hypothetical protein